MSDVSRLRWLFGEGRRHLFEGIESSLNDTSSGRAHSGLSTWQSELLREQRSYHVRARDRFPSLTNWIWTDRSLQQATDERSAHFTASLFPQDAMVIDGCCGAGSNAFALARHGCRTVAVDNDRAMCELARSNLQHQGLSAEIVHADVMTILADRKNVFVHFDPDRRPGDRRTQQGDQFQPPLDALCGLAERAAGAAIKVAPGTEFDEPHALYTSGPWKRIWIGRNRECPVQLLVRGAVDQPAFAHSRSAVLLQDMRAPLIFSADPETAESIDEISHRFLYELHPALYAAELSGAWAAGNGLACLGGSLGYFFGDERIDSPWLQGFEILGIEAWDDRKIRAWLRKFGAGELEVKKRLIQLDANLYQRKYSQPEGTPVTCLVTRIGRSTKAVFAKRLSSSVQSAT
ncbi:MAG: methyltransferase domain-containing protein [Pirellulales bacterium]